MSSCKRFKLFDPHCSDPSTSAHSTVTNWELCLICQEEKSEELRSPALSKRSDKGSGYTSLAENLMKFSELGQLPRTLQLERLDEGCGIAAAMFANNARYHHTCCLKFNNTMLSRAHQRKMKADSQCEDLNEQPVLRRTMPRSSVVAENKDQEDLCFFCKQASGPEELHEASTFQLDSRVRACAHLLADTDLIARLSVGDMVALEAKYHAKCLAGLYNEAKKIEVEETKSTGRESEVSATVFAESVLYIEEARLDENTAPIFKLVDLGRLYTSRLEQLGVETDGRVHTTRLKQRLLAHFPDMRANNKGRDVLLAFSEDCGSALGKAYELDRDSDAVNLARAAQVVRRQMFGEGKPFTGFPDGCQEESVPPLLLALVSMVLDGPSIKDQLLDNTPATLAIAQLLKFNSVKHKRTQSTTASVTVRHSSSQETPVPIYTGLMLHAHTRKKELIDRLFTMGMSISYDRVLQLSAQMGESVCQQFHLKNVVCSPKMRHGVFTTSAVDNIDHNPSSTTAKGSFHGTAISLFQHPSISGEGVSQSIDIAGASEIPCSKKIISRLPTFYTDILPVAIRIKHSVIPPSSTVSPSRDGFQMLRKEENLWLNNAMQRVEEDTPCSKENTSWAAFHAGRQHSETKVICPSALLPLFLESAHTVSMIRHSLGVVKDAIKYLNPGQTPVITFDQPLFALAKQVQWTWPEIYGEDKMVVMFGGLHIEMTALKMVGGWLQGSGWTQALVQADIATSGTADSFLRATHVTRTRRAHQVTAAALYILQRRAYDRCPTNQLPEGGHKEDFEDWCRRREQTYPQFQYWATVLELELMILIYVRSLRESSFAMYLDALTELVHWFHALDHTNYARWIPVHLRDMVNLEVDHPDVAREFMAGKFTVQKTTKMFSSIPIDQAHEQNNALIKGDGGAVGLTDNPTALHRWMVAGPEISRIIEEFQNGNPQRLKTDTHHHDQTDSVQTAFLIDVRSLVRVIEELGNPFEEDGVDLIVLDTKEIAGPEAMEVVRNVRKIGREQLNIFTRERLIERTKPIDDIIPRNKLKVFGRSSTKNLGRGKQQLATLKNDVTLFSRLYIGCQTRDGDLDDFFRHENQAYPPSLSDGGSIRLGTKSDLLQCLEELAEPRDKAPPVTCTILDGAAVIQMLKPATARNFEEYSSSIFIPYLCTKFHDVSRIDLVWDIYRNDSLKGTARRKRGKGLRRRVIATAPIPRNWQSFLCNDSNKTELFSFISQAAIAWFQDGNKQLVITDGQDVLHKPPLDDLSSIAPCNHEEADSRMLLHASHASQHGHQKILIRTVDTDVVVLAVYVAQELKPSDELWIAFGTGKSFRYLAAHEMSAALGPEKARALPLFHAVTGCDTVSCFAGHGKKAAWAVWAVLPELTDALLKVSSEPTDIPKDDLSTIERFVILLYDRTSTSTDIDKARKKSFVKKNNVQFIPPTRAALQLHIKRAIYQSCHVWGQTLERAPELPQPTEWGWTKADDGMFEPHWTTLPEAAKICQELVSCKCKKGCVRRCSCKKAALQCTALCLCEGDCAED